MKANPIHSWDGFKTGSKPIFMKTDKGYNFTAIAIDDNINRNDKFVVIFIGTNDGHILKMAPILKNGKYGTQAEHTAFIEERYVFDENECGSNNK